ncbi:hypothetical protein SAMD00019534_040900 [Acytostelium subglobosum LB1]|uniref:hypothetical protein n=1 Tax=Acytostelium subglobosum LB1 TaxID=1410327 RepID=UPI0006450D85|nr:hypothetical protein SAMD00019534_040900 [Acytostelium subglobosum LB1]GAM20915.1 hypothetical protein SAMD00019534_040900 [Acytostelium subglobosum LB1]|eukprot:XP_012756049.1 hypothetical protein SAMD00019534_040900 [Acytostelium subglobosum LB1]
MIDIALAIMSRLNNSIDYRSLIDEMFDQYPSEINRYIRHSGRGTPTVHGPSRYYIPSNKYFMIKCNRLGYLDDDHVVDYINRYEGGDSHQDIYELINTSINPVDQWISFIDINNALPDPEGHYQYSYILETIIMDDRMPKLHPAVAFQLLKHQYLYTYITRDSYMARRFKDIKTRVMDRVDNEHPDYNHYSEQFDQFKQQSFKRENKSRPVMRYTYNQVSGISYPTSTSTPKPTLPPLIIKLIVEMVVLADHLNMEWVLMLSTISKQFHNAVSMTLSNNVITTLNIHSMINHIGSQYCLFKTPPLHIAIEHLVHITDEYVSACLENLQSLIVPFAISEPWDGTGNVMFYLVDAPRLCQIKFTRY